MIPYITFLFVYIVYSMIFSHELLNDEKESQGGFKFVQVLLVIFCMYFLAFESYQLYHNGSNYFYDMWNYVDVIPPCLIIYTILLESLASYEKLEATVQTRYGLQAFTSFFMWNKIFDFLRIFRDTGFFVNMLKEIIKKSSVFLLLYMLILAAFTSTFYILTPGEVEGTFFGVLFYSYLLSLGDFGDMEWHNYYAPAMF